MIIFINWYDKNTIQCFATCLFWEKRIRHVTYGEKKSKPSTTYQETEDVEHAQFFWPQAKLLLWHQPMNILLIENSIEIVLTFQREKLES